MRITKLETIRLRQHANLLWARVYTDADVTGLGETWFGAAVCETDIHERIAPLILGEDPRRIQHLHRSMHPYAGFFGVGAEMRALSAVDVALWDIAGKLANKPVHDLLGGATRSSIPLYNTCAGPDYVSQSADVRPGNFGLGEQQSAQYEDLTAFMEQPAELAASLLDMGINSMKIWPFDFAEGAADGVDISNDDLKRAMLPFEQIRAAHGDKMRIKAELHGLWSLPAAQKICSALEPIQPDWVEDPIWMDRIADIKKLAHSTFAPLAGGETLGGIAQIRELIEQGEIATPIIDVTWGGGITFAHKCAAIAESFSKPIAFHDCSGPITLCSSVHLALSAPNVVEQEFTRGFYYSWYHTLVDQLPPIENGRISAPSGPGLGVHLRDDVPNREDAMVRVTEL